MTESSFACDPAFNPVPVDYVVPLGSDDWVDWRLFQNLPAPDTMVGFQRMAFVREDGRELTVRHIRSEGGCGIRIWPRHLMAQMDYRPADEDRRRGCDTSMLVNTRQRGGDEFRVEHRDLDPLQIVDWKTAGENLNPYESLARHRQELNRDPFDILAGRYPADLLEQMRDHYDRACWWRRDTRGVRSGGQARVPRPPSRHKSFRPGLTGPQNHAPLRVVTSACCGWSYQ